MVCEQAAYVLRNCSEGSLARKETAGGRRWPPTPVLYRPFPLQLEALNFKLRYSE